MQNRDISEFSKCGVLIFDIEDNEFHSKLVNEVLKCFEGAQSLSQLHEKFNETTINEKRLSGFRAINKLESWEQNYFSLASEKLTTLVGPDILIQNKLNLSVQMPFDKSSQLGLHTDVLSGESEFEIVLWVPLTDAYDTNSMYMFDYETTNEIYEAMPAFEKMGMGALFEEFHKKAHFLNLKKGEALIFSPTLFHGNVINETKHSRVSINCRFKSLFSPEFSEFPTERKAGPFYKLLHLSPVTEFGIRHNDGKVKF